jgi:hypothetical protein
VNQAADDNLIFSPSEPDRFLDPVGLLYILFRQYHPTEICTMLRTSANDLSAWADDAVPNPDLETKIIELHMVLTYAHHRLKSDAGRWLINCEPSLYGARPIDVLSSHGAGPVICALARCKPDAYSRNI